MLALILTITIGLTIWGAAAIALLAAVGFATGGDYPDPTTKEAPGG